MSHNAMWNARNPNQNQSKHPTVLCVCSAGLLRSPTLAYVLSNRGYNTRAAGIYDYALVRVSDTLLHWADYIVCVQQEHADYLVKNMSVDPSKISVLHVPDRYAYRDPELIKIIEEELDGIDFLRPL